MNIQRIREACLLLGFEEPISIELDGTVWIGPDDDREYPDMDTIWAEVERLEAEKQQQKNEILERLGLTSDELQVLLK